LYTSLDRDGAVAELAFHLSQISPAPRKPIVVNRLSVVTRKSIRLSRADLMSLGVDAARYLDTNYIRTQEIGEAVSFLEHDALRVPSARWTCDNLVLFPLNHAFDDKLEFVDSETVDWLAWVKEHPFS
jgi:hypothetical protein